ncbi:hypothetical protein ZWY2020_003047 [Hordeum vulgare]|nr:hypothetical protein ZWY2020_003047 [Hordeum vulgare]
MERFFTGLVFYEAPLDGYTMSVLTARVVNMVMVSGGSATKPATVASRADTESEEGSSDCKATAQRHAGFEIAFDGLNCFDTFVMLKIRMRVAGPPRAVAAGPTYAVPFCCPFCCVAGWDGIPGRSPRPVAIGPTSLGP